MFKDGRTKHDTAAHDQGTHYVQQSSSYPDHSSTTGSHHHHRSRNYSPNRGAAAAPCSDRDVQMQHLSDSGVDVRGRDKVRKRGVVGDVLWMLRIKTFQV